MRGEVILSLFLFFAFLAGFAAILLFKTSKTFSFSVTNLNSVEVSKDRWNILILGHRGRSAPSGGILTDSIILLSYQKSSKTLGIFSFPRDLWVKIQKNQWAKLNTAYVIGEEKGKGQGLILAKKVVEEISGVDIDGVIVIDVEGVKELVDLLGGIEIEENRSFQTFFYNYSVRIHPGKNLLNGGQTLAYIGSRDLPGADFDRMKRQQKVLLALKDKIFSLNLLLRPDKIWKILSVLERHIETDIPLSQAISNLPFLSSLSVEKTVTIVFDTSNYLYHPPTDWRGYILLPKEGAGKYSKIQRAIEEVFKNKNL
jgi:LCP family protein required for cell wall assembly